MKYSLIYSIALFFSISFTTYSIERNKTFLDDGIVYFRGGIVEPACTVSPESKNQIVDLGIISSNQFNGVGSHSIKLPFFINLMNCNKNMADKVSLYILGDVNSIDKRLFNITEKQNSASGVGVALFNSEDEMIIPNNINKYKFIKENELKIEFKASYLATKETVIGGKADSVVWFVFNYH
ncbi:fimbrial protein [Proteus penneri]|uniref:Type-1 fimbrial protein, A chain n=1 Tax=Proteus penneri TaxID=102862 RepID=A0A0G4QAK8_9GAMM|nr:fimbrial protein [Proteus penneri]CRL62915.1 Type-1 fimbrial protein, A chain precursor [Proteus penneri]